MPIFKTKLEVIASEEEIQLYYEISTQKINLLLEQYNIRNDEDRLEQVSADKVRALLSFTGFFQATPLKTIFFDQKKQFIPSEIIDTFRSIISDPPVNIKAIFFNTFIDLLTKKKWIEALSEYFEKYYNCPPNGIIILTDLKDYSLGFGVYRATLQLRTPCIKEIIVFFKKTHNVSSYNEILYFHLQKELLSTASFANLPYRLVNKESKEEILLSPLIPGIAADTTLSLLAQAYRKTQDTNHKCDLKKTIEILIEEFINHATLGDLLGRNDRHLLNSLIAFVADDTVQNGTIEDLMDPKKIVAYTKNILRNKTKAISLIDFDLKWLLDEKNSHWALVDIDFGLSEINLLSLLPEFNDYNSKMNISFEKRKEYIAYYFKAYCQKQEAILEKKELLFDAIKKMYPSDISWKKLKLLTERINFLEKGKEPIIKLFKRYLLNFRIRLIHKTTLVTLDRIAKKSNYADLLKALNETSLIKYLPSGPVLLSYKSSIFLQLQCFRGVLSKKDMNILSKQEGTPWETVASNIAMLAEKFNIKLSKQLEDKKKFIEKDTAAIIKHLKVML